MYVYQPVYAQHTASVVSMIRSEPGQRDDDDEAVAKLDTRSGGFSGRHIVPCMELGERGWW